MSTEVHQIPPAPRRSVRWSAALWFRWPLALGGFLLAVYGGLWTLMLFFASSGKPIDDSRLDVDPEIATGIVIETREVQAEWRGAEMEQVWYHFVLDGVDLHGRCFAPKGHAAGQAVAVEFAPDAPHVSRLASGRISLLGDFVTPAFWITVVPGLGMVALWLFGAARMRALYVHGDVAVARIDSVAKLAWVVPTMFLVDYEFRDRRAQSRRGRHWVRARSRLGQRLQRPGTLAVVHDREHPERNRLVVADEF